MLMLAIVPMSVAGTKTTNTSSDPNTTDIGRTIVRGLVFGYKPGGVITRFFAIRIHFTEITGTQTIHGVLRFRYVETGKFIGGYSNDFMAKGFFTYMLGMTFHGGISAM